MHVYRFKITAEENDEFIRDVEFIANQTFEDIHQFIKETCGFKSNELASFYTCDNQWRRKQEITLMDMGEDEENNSSAKTLIMKNAKLNQVINDPHQKIIYIYDFIALHTFYLELFKVQPIENRHTYPLLNKSIGELLIQTGAAKTPVFDEEFEEVIPKGIGDDDDELSADSEEETQAEDEFGIGFSDESII